MEHFWLIEVSKIVVLYLVGYLLGHLVQTRGVKVNYTRKVIHFLFFFTPLYLETIFPFSRSTFTFVCSGLVYIIFLFLLCRPFRSRSSFLTTVFASIDRPEDRPYTITWIWTQLVVTYIVLALMLKWLGVYGKEVLILITVLVNAIGDGLAEPVGVRFGKHKYRTRALFTDRTYTRSLEGSMCVFITGIAAVLLLSEHLTPMQVNIGLLIIPVAMTVAMTVAEAFSPHTWDGPFLYLAGGVSTVLVLELSGLIG